MLILPTRIDNCLFSDKFCSNNQLSNVCMQLIKQLKEQLGLTNKELALLTGLTESHISMAAGNLRQLPLSANQILFHLVKQLEKISPTNFQPTETDMKELINDISFVIDQNQWELNRVDHKLVQLTLEMKTLLQLNTLKDAGEKEGVFTDEIIKRLLLIKAPVTGYEMKKNWKNTQKLLLKKAQLMQEKSLLEGYKQKLIYFNLTKT